MNRRDEKRMEALRDVVAYQRGELELPETPVTPAPVDARPGPQVHHVVGPLDRLGVVLHQQDRVERAVLDPGHVVDAAVGSADEPDRSDQPDRHGEQHGQRRRRTDSSTPGRRAGP